MRGALIPYPSPEITPLKVMLKYEKLFVNLAFEQRNHPWCISLV